MSSHPSGSDSDGDLAGGTRTLGGPGALGGAAAADTRSSDSSSSCEACCSVLEDPQLMQVCVPL